MSRVLYLVRHGQSEWNVRRLTQGQTAHPALTALGREQAHAAAGLIEADLAGQPVSRLVSSDLVRAHQSAQIIAARLSVAVDVDVRLREQHLGDLEGKPYEQTWAAAAEIDWTDPALPIANGESLLEVTARMADVLEELDRGDGIAVVVTHGDAIRSAIAHLRGQPPHQAEWVEVANGAVARVTESISWLG